MFAIAHTVIPDLNLLTGPKVAGLTLDAIRVFALEYHLYECGLVESVVQTVV